MSETRKIAAILCADVVGYSRLAGADEDRILARLRALRSDLIDPTIAVHHGRVVKRTGDGLLIEFRSVVDAVRCAVEVQNAMVDRNAGVPAEAAPLARAARGGAADFGRRRRVVVADANRPATVAAKPAAEAARLSIVVLPFANLSGDPTQDYLVDALTDELITLLARIRANSFVIARNTAMTFKGKAVDAKAIGRELGVRYVLEGSVQPSAGQMRVNAQLIDAGSGAHIWAEQFDTPTRRPAANTGCDRQRIWCAPSTMNSRGRERAPQTDAGSQSRSRGFGAAMRRRHDEGGFYRQRRGCGVRFVRKSDRH